MGESLDTSPIRFGNYLSEALSPFYQGVADYVGEYLGRPTTLETGSSSGDLTRGPIDVGFL
jgi:hypothetical protein